jgi:ABC-2 type transport system permease protein
MRSRKIYWIVRKDLAECLGNRIVVIPMIILPLMLCVIMPAAMIVLGLSQGVLVMNGSQFIERILPLYNIPAIYADAMDRLLYVFLNYTMMPFFLIIPMMASSVIAANSVAGEKERKTLETLLYAPLSNREFVMGKLLSAFIPSMAMSLGAFLLYFAVANGLHLAMRGTIIVGSVSWIPALLLLVPAASLFGLGCSLIASIKARSYLEAQQASAIVVVPILALIGAQISGLLVMSPWAIVAAALVLFGIDYLVILRAAPRFERERLLSCL